MSRRNTKPGPSVVVDYRYREGQMVNKTEGRSLPTGIEVWVCAQCGEYILEPRHKIEARHGHVHITGEGLVCDNYTKFHLATDPDPVIAAYLIGGPTALLELAIASGLKEKQPVGSPLAEDNWPDVGPPDRVVAAARAGLRR